MYKQRETMRKSSKEELRVLSVAVFLNVFYGAIKFQLIASYFLSYVLHTKLETSA